MSPLLTTTKADGPGIGSLDLELVDLKFSIVIVILLQPESGMGTEGVKVARFNVGSLKFSLLFCLGLK